MLIWGYMENKRESKSITRKQYSAEFITEAVRLVTSGERSQAEVARNLGIGSTTISKWVQAAKGTRNPEANKADSAEVRELKAEIKRLKLEQDILKKAAAYFAKNQM
jgi:transposase